MQTLSGRTHLEYWASLVLVALIGLMTPAGPVRAEAPAEVAEMQKARSLLEEANELAADHPNQANRKRRLALEQLELAWQNRQDPVALFRSALVFARLFERPVAAAQAAQRYLAAMEYRGMDVTTEDSRSRTAAAEELVRAGLRAARSAEPEPDPEAACLRAALRPTEGLMRVDDPVNGRFLLIRETERGKVFATNCSTDVVARDEHASALLWSGGAALGVAAILGGAVASYVYGPEDSIMIDGNEFVDGDAKVQFAGGVAIGAAALGAVGLGLLITGLVEMGGDDQPEVTAARPTVTTDARGAPAGLGFEVRF